MLHLLFARETEGRFFVRYPYFLMLNDGYYFGVLQFKKSQLET